MSAKLAAEEAYTVAEAAALKRVSYDTIARAIHATEGNTLAAKNVSSGKRPTYRIAASALEAWFEGLRDA
jgi:excisionase family DNA binding protein